MLYGEAKSRPRFIVPFPLPGKSAMLPSIASCDERDRMTGEISTPRSSTYTALWLRWVVANAFGELLGLGSTFAVGVLFYTIFPDQSSIVMILAAFVVAVASGSIEATIVGLFQWRAMHPWFPAIPRRSWWLATLIGALVAYVLGYLPSTIMSLGEQAAPAASAAAEPSQWIILLLAAGLGLVGGCVLSFAQWRVLRRYARGSGWWIPANSLAWIPAMTLIFWAIDAAQKGQPVTQSILLMASVLFVSGALVGAIHGAFLVKIAQKTRSKDSDTKGPQNF